MKEIIAAVKTVGFPIVMCILLYYLVVTVVERNTQAINNNTVAITRVCATVERLDALNR